MLQTLKDTINRSWIGQLRYLQREKRNLATWEQNGRPVPAPALIKQDVIRDIANRSRTRVLVETGTLFGDMIFATLDSFDRLYSIEVNQQLYDRAVKRFSKYPKVKILLGDSGKKIQDVLSEVDQPCLFWLDGHYSGGITGRGELDTPIMQELTHIFSHRVKEHVLLIDDARCFVGADGYPTLDQLRTFCLQHRPHWKFNVDLDIIRVHA